MVSDSTRQHTDGGVTFAKEALILLKNDGSLYSLRNDALSSGISDLAPSSKVELDELYKTNYSVDRFHRCPPMKMIIFPCRSFQRRIFWRDAFRFGVEPKAPIDIDVQRQSSSRWTRFTILMWKNVLPRHRLSISSLSFYSSESYQSLCVDFLSAGDSSEFRSVYMCT